MEKRLLKTSKNWRLVISALLWYGLTAANFTANAQTPYALWCSGEGDADTTPTMYFTCSSDSIYVGDKFNGQTVTAKWRDENVTDTPKEGEPSWMGGHPLSYWGPMKRVVFDESFKSVRPHSTAYWFCHWNKLTEIVGLENLNTSEVTSMQGMFIETGLTSLDLRTFDTSNVTNMSIMFGQNRTLTSINLSSFDTSKVENMSMMFNDCPGLTYLDLSNFDTSQTTNYFLMFLGCSNLEVIHVDEFVLNDIGVFESLGMFSNCSSLQKIYCNHNWTFAQPTPEDGVDGNYMFQGCTSLIGENGTTYDETKMHGQYAQLDGSAQKGYFSTPGVAQVLWTEGNRTLTFVYALPYFVGDTFNGQTVSAVWSGDDVLNNNRYVSPNWFAKWCDSESGINLLVEKAVFDPSFIAVRPQSTMGWFFGLKNLTSIENMENLRTSEVTDMIVMFAECSHLTSLDLSNFDTGKVQMMYGMFYGCSALQEIDMSSFNTSNVLDMTAMFSGCESLEVLDVSSFDVSNLHVCSDENGENASMFANCTKLTTIFCDKDWRQESQLDTTYDNLFYNTPVLVGGQGATWDAEKQNADYANPDLYGLFTYTTEVIQGKFADGYYWSTYYFSPINTYADEKTTVFTATLSDDRKSLTLNELDETNFQKAQGVILRSTEEYITLKHSSRKATSDFSNNNLLGYDQKVAVPTDQGTIYTLGMKNGVLGFYRYTGSTLAARRAYLAIANSSEAGFRFDFNGGTATAIDEVQDTRVQQDGVYYNLAGQRVSESALTPGIYIVNGKKIVKK